MCLVWQVTYQQIHECGRIGDIDIIDEKERAFEAV